MSANADKDRETLEYYERNARRYSERREKTIDLAALREFSSRLPPGGRVLDAGCGPGLELRWLRQAGFAAEGVDFSPAMVELARELSGAPVRQADLRLLALPAGGFDGIWARRSLVHLDPPGCQRVMGTFFALLRPGGWLFAAIETGGMEGEPEALSDRREDPEGPARWIYRYCDEDFESLLRQSGFRVVLTGHEVGAPERKGYLAQRV